MREGSGAVPWEADSHLRRSGVVFVVVFTLIISVVITVVYGVSCNVHFDSKS